ncbi:MAG: DUF3303 family protein [Pseudomonadota bacterium]
MKFMVSWSVDQDRWPAILEKWGSMSPAERADVGDGVTMIGRWHDLVSRTGVLIIEATDTAAVTTYLGNWNPHMDIDVVPVLDDEESAEVARQIVANQA